MTLSLEVSRIHIRGYDHILAHIAISKYTLHPSIQTFSSRVIVKVAGK